jgi:small subunit ribosomal protein S11
MVKPPTQTRIRRKEKKNVTNAVAHVNSSFNNTVITITDIQGNAISWSSSGSMGFKGSRKSTPYAAQLAAEVIGEKAYYLGIRDIRILFKGMGKGRFSVPKGLKSSGLKIKTIIDNTPVPHNGCRPPKKRRV